jgi:excisionase family DNA binding protein
VALDIEPTSSAGGSAEDELITEAPSARAKALRDEIFGSALTLDEAAYVLGLDRTTVAKYLRENSLVGFQIGREWLVPEDELRAFVQRIIEQRRAEAVRAPAPTCRPESDRPRVGFELLFGRRRRRANDRFERFTERARTVLSRAQTEAQSLNHDFLGTEHLLLGLLTDDDPAFVRLLDDLGLEPREISAEVHSVVARGTTRGARAGGEIGLTSRSKKALELAVEESVRLHRETTGTEHLLLGLIREGDGVAAAVLKRHGVDLERARAAVSRVDDR